MFRSIFLLCAISLFGGALSAQTGPRRSVVRASGEGVVAVKPDQVRVSVGVTTQAQTAQQAGDDNAAATNKVIAELRAFLGANADIRTLGYSLNPRYENAGGGVSRINGYTANNTVQVTLNDLSLPGRVIDTAIGAGATNVNGVTFQLKDPQPARTQALRLATMQAKSNAEAIVTGLGLRLGSILIAEEGSSVRVSPVLDNRLAATGSTPIEAGNVEVRASVAIEAEMTQ